MTGRPAASQAAGAAALGAIVATLRARGVRWKTLQRLFDRERTQLWRLMRRAEMQQTRVKMQHLWGCEAGGIREITSGDGHPRTAKGDVSEP